MPQIGDGLLGTITKTEEVFTTTNVYINICCNRYFFSFRMAFNNLSAISVFLSSEDRKAEMFCCYSIVGTFTLNAPKSFF